MRPPRELPIVALLLLSLMWLPLGCFRREPPPNILLITLDTTRADRLGCYGYEDAATPSLDSIAEHGVLFERAYTPVPFTLPAHTSMLTGLYPPEHALHLNGKSALHESIPTVTQRLQEAGYQTGAFVASFVLNRKFGLDRGFDVYDDSLDGAVPTVLEIHRYRNGRLVTNAALKWLDQLEDDAPFFCWVHLYDPHTPYHAHRDLFGERYLDEPYDGEIRFMDRQVGRLLQFLNEGGLTERTLVLAVGDHGEGMGDHGELRHGNLLYGSVTRVPFVCAMPRTYGEGLRVSSTVSILSVAPTIQDVAGVRSDTSYSAPSLLAALRGEDIVDADVYGETDEPFVTYGWSPLRSVTTERWRYIKSTRPELYDLLADPAEATNLVQTLPERSLDLEALLAELQDRMTVGKAETVHLSADQQRVLESLGYVSGGSGPSSATPGQDLADIKDKIHLVNRTDEANELMEADQLPQAIALMRATSEEEPNNVMFRQSLGQILMRAEHFEEAVEVFQGMVERSPDSTHALNLLGNAYYRTDDLPRATEAYLEAIELDPDHADAHSNLAVALDRQGRDEEAAEHWRTAIRLKPDLIEARQGLAVALERRGGVEEALLQWEAILNMDPLHETAFLQARRLRGTADRAAQ